MTWTCWYCQPCCVIYQYQIFNNYKRGMDRKQKTKTHDSKHRCKQQQAAHATYQPSPLSRPTQAIQKSLSCNENKAQKLICNKTLNRKTQRKKDCFLPVAVNVWVVLIPQRCHTASVTIGLSISHFWATSHHVHWYNRALLHLKLPELYPSKAPWILHQRLTKTNKQQQKMDPTMRSLETHWCAYLKEKDQESRMILVTTAPGYTKLVFKLNKSTLKVKL